MGPTIKIEQFGPGAAEVRKRLDSVSEMEVLVGIPQEKDKRRGEKIGNAALLYIFTNGSPLRKIPARPVIEAAITAEGNKQAIAVDLQKAAAAQLEKDPQLAIQFLRRAGTTGANVSKAWFTDARNNWAPNTASTIKRKKSERPGIDTGAMRRSITWSVRLTRVSR
jgi:hypothetical protein